MADRSELREEREELTRKIRESLVEELIARAEQTTLRPRELFPKLYSMLERGWSNYSEEELEGFLAGKD